VTVAERFGRNLFMARRRAGLTQEALARQAPSHQENISELERGVHCPNLRTVIRLAGALEMPVCDLLRGIG
jgi:DNA-binding XRE family transcriptional regulator